MPGVQLDPEERHRDRLMFLWCILNRTTAKTNATITTIVRKITHLMELMSEKDSNVQELNTTLRQLMNSYYANKREKPDEDTLINNSFEAYLTCKDDNFIVYMKRQESDYIDNNVVFTVDSLMEKALKHYQTLVAKKTWGQMSTK
jgi:hypothetical protein